MKLLKPCDTPALREEIETLAQESPSMHITHSKPGQVALIDIAPLVEKHTLIIQTTQVQASLDLPKSKSFWASRHDFIQAPRADSGFSSCTLIKHGSRTGYCGPSYLRQVLVFLALKPPVDCPGVIERFFANHLNILSRHATLLAAISSKSYLTVSSCQDHWTTGAPNPEVRQCSRRLIAKAYHLDLRLVYWGVATEVRLRRVSIDRIFNKARRVDHVHVPLSRSARAKPRF